MKSFKAIFALFIFSIGLVGCNAGASTTDTIEPGQTSQTEMSPRGPGETTNAQGSSQGQGGSSDGIRPMAGVGAGGLTPIQGAESVGGEGGGGVGQAAKDRAREVAGSPNSSVGSAAADDDH